MSEKTVIIIGAGLGGLVVGALLAKEGFKVTIVEKNHQIGGGLQSYKRFGVTFDTGMHIFGGMAPDGNIRKLCAYLDILDEFEVKDIDAANNLEVFVENTGENYKLSLNSEWFVESFSKYFPHEKDNLAKYEQAIEQIMQEFDLYYLRSAKSKPRTSDSPSDFTLAASELINKYVTDPKLQSLLAIVNTLYAGERNISPAFLHAAITMSFLNGACRVVDGYSNFAAALEGFIKGNGGTIVTQETIDKINTEGRNASGVTSKSGLDFKSSYIVSSIPLSTTIGMIDNKSLLSQSYITAVREKVPSLSTFIVNIKLKKDTLPFSNGMGFYLESYDSVWSAYDGTSIEKFMFTTPPVSNQGEYAETLNILLPMKWSVVSRWENTKVGSRGPEYLEFKESLQKEIIKKLSLIIPDIENMIEYVDTSSPLTIRDYTGVAQGAMCGDRKDCNDPLVFMPVSTRIPNLFFTGQNINMHGFCGVTLTAIQTCEAILGHDYIINKINKTL